MSSSSSDDSDIDGENDTHVRAHHNAQERMRRDVIKECFDGLRDALPCFLRGQNVSREQILRKAAEYNVNTRRRIAAHQRDVAEMNRYNKGLNDEIRALEKAKATGNRSSVAAIIEKYKNANSKVARANPESESESEDSSDDSDDSEDSPRKKKSKKF